MSKIRHFNHMMRFVFLTALLNMTAPELEAAERMTYLFSTTWDVGHERAVFLVGSQPDTGDWDVSRAIRLNWGSGNVWSADVSLPKGTDLFYKFVSKPATPSGYCDSGQVIWQPGDNEFLAVPDSGESRAKTVRYLSGLHDVQIHYRDADQWKSMRMIDAGPGRQAGERLYRSEPLHHTGPLEFVFQGHNNAGQEVWDQPATPAPYSTERNYSTPCDYILVQDGQVFNYAPPPSVTPSTIQTAHVQSSSYGIPSRQIRIYLPRGYSQNTNKRYPVLYMHDGQAVFQPGNEYGCWYAEHQADTEIGQGRMRETIIIAIDNNGQNRIWEYLPANDSLAFIRGKADAYAHFLIRDVKAFVDREFRTLPDRDNTAVLGSSMGGLVSAYLAMETTAFKHAGIMSPAFTHSPNNTSQLRQRPKKEVRLYIDWGTNEDDGFGGDYWNPPASVYQALCEKGYAINNNLKQQVGCGHAHNEWAWNQRLPTAFRFLMDISSEPTPEVTPEAPTLIITNPSAHISVGNHEASFTLAGFSSAGTATHLAWSNTLNGISGIEPFNETWSFSVPLDDGPNTIRVVAVAHNGDEPAGMDQADHPAYASGWQSGDNGGTGFEGWHLEHGPAAGFFVASRHEYTNLKAAETAWGLWANSGDTATAVRPFSREMNVGSTLAFTFENNWIEQGQSVGWALQNEEGEYLLEFLFIGGNDHYMINDADGLRESEIPWTDTGLHTRIEIIDENTYRITINGTTLSGRFAERSNNSKARIAFWNWSAGSGGEYNLFISELSLTNPGYVELCSDQTVISRATRSPDQNQNMPIVSCSPATGKGEGLVIRWSSAEGQRYTIEKTHDLRAGFHATEFSNMPATPPLNSVIDPAPLPESGAVFYRIRVVQ